ncbi:hypothetical protein Acor_33680 [Acrocarpospora corrugata]|uniref:Uncharacterized protein n=1 Tax=Acrocarpospora corrugata TaxID=35763 RepID=A0A5M3VXW5_9ACTN|nr:hypothetical protein Acor_33680 [Acrocarpospora corrugata]
MQKSAWSSSCSLSWRNEGERELVWTIDPGHPIAAGVDQPIVIGEQEMHGEPFDIPDPDEVAVCRGGGDRVSQRVRRLLETASAVRRAAG